MTESQKIIVHHLNNSRSQRILWLLEELEVPYEIKRYERTEDMLAPKELRDVHPLGLSPVITDGEIVLAESGAIVGAFPSSWNGNDSTKAHLILLEYLIGKYGAGRFNPPESGYVDNLYFTHYTEGTLMPLFVNRIIFTVAPQRAPFFIRPVMNLIFGML
ncbi:hypothetical protein FRC12_012816, partial [Ceratobasidium sp. 428]